ncbi:MAG: hypothetical protein BWY69_00089 [Planctomycetes bacterium ADurb.Bin401]|nr:MAG: hypothetical protein BWY69_00089 [Planctomycetes bacterium ADurb.Bin401]
MGKLQFFEMRAEEMATMYAQDFTKKQAVDAGTNLVKSMIDEGNVDKLQFAANLFRLNEVVAAAATEMRNHLPLEKTQIFGVEFTPVNGGNTLNYADDPVYVQLKADLDARVELLKLAQKQEVLDTGGIEVPKVSTTPRKSSVTIKF